MKKIISTVIAIAMILSTMGMVAFAEDNVAEINGTGYSTIHAAINAAQPGDEVKLLDDIKLTGKLTITKAVTINGDGNSITADEDAVWYTVSGKLGLKTYNVHLIGVNSDNVILKNIVLDNNNNAAGINIYCAQNVVFDNVSIINATKGTAALTVNGSTLTIKNKFETLGNTIAMDIDLGSGVTTPLGVTVEDGTIFDLADKIVKFDPAAENDMTGAKKTDGTSYFAAKDNAYYYTVAQLESRTSEFSNGLTLLADFELSNALKVRGTLDLNGATITVNEAIVITKDTTIKNGTIIGADGENGVTAPVTPVVVNNAVLNLVNVKIVGGKLVDETGYTSMTPFADAVHATDAELNVTDSELVGGDTDCDYDMPGSAIVAVSSDVNVVNSRLSSGTSDNVNSIGNGIIRATDSDVSLEDVKLYAFPGTQSHPMIYDNVDSEKYPYDYDIEMSGTITVEEGSNPLSDLANIVIPEGEDVVFEGEVDTDTIKILTRKITVKYVDNGLNGEGEKNEGKKVYDIMLVADNGKYINELASAEFTFSFVPESVIGSKGSMSYTIEAVDDMTLIKLGDHYEFNYAGTDVYENTDSEIKIGTLTVEGYGSFDFSIVDDGRNMVNATKTADSIVDTFVPGGILEDGTMGGDLDISEKPGNAEIKVPSRELEININFNNAVEKKNADYQQMKVEVYGGDLEKTVEINLSDVAQNVNADLAGKTDAVYTVDASVDNKYVVTLTNALTVNTTYNVKVSGAGYRDAYYTVTMTDSKVLNFWNNVKDAADYMENGKESTKKAVNFLAGDIVKDNIINIYDLSAVVSYFGETDLVGNNDGYAKYDLNRDGKIDSKDVAYVLVSWGN